MVPVATRRASTSVVLPAPEWPTSTTLRIRLGSSTVGALPTAAPAGLDLPAMTALPTSDSVTQTLPPVRRVGQGPKAPDPYARLAILGAQCSESTPGRRSARSPSHWLGASS